MVTKKKTRLRSLAILLIITMLATSFAPPAIGVAYAQSSFVPPLFDPYELTGLATAGPPQLTDPMEPRSKPYPILTPVKEAKPQSPIN